MIFSPFTCCVCAGFTLKIQKPQALKLKPSVKRSVNSTLAPFLSDKTEAELRGSHHFFNRTQNYVHIL
jgi:hypothetical protein